MIDLHVHTTASDGQYSPAQIIEKAAEKNIKSVVFDRSGYIYHGVIKELAEAAREGGLEF